MKLANFVKSACSAYINTVKEEYANASTAQKAMFWSGVTITAFGYCVEIFYYVKEKIEYNKARKEIEAE